MQRRRVCIHPTATKKAKVVKAKYLDDSNEEESRDNTNESEVPAKGGFCYFCVVGLVLKESKLRREPLVGVSLGLLLLICGPRVHS